MMPSASVRLSVCCAGCAMKGPLAGTGARAIALASTAQFQRQARMAQPTQGRGNSALNHVLKIEMDVAQAATGLQGNHAFRTDFPPGQFGNAVKTAAQVIASPSGVAAVRLTLNGFDTHVNQSNLHANLLRQLGEGLAALKAALIELGRWERTLVMTYAEFGRRPKENGIATPTMNMKNGWTRSQNRSPFHGWWWNWVKIAPRKVSLSGESRTAS